MNDHRSIVVSHLSSFRPSDRDALDTFMNDPTCREETLRAIERFVADWENADWLEAYAIERIGKWIAKTQSPDAVAALELWSAAHKTEARTALENGLRRGVEEKLTVPA